MKLHYLALRARGEPLRMLLAHAKVDYQYVSIPLSEWSAIKETMPPGKTGARQVPVLELDDGTLMPESLDIAKCICQQVADDSTRKMLLGGDHPEMAEEAVMSTALLLINPLLNWFSVEEAEEKIPSFLASVPDAYKLIASTTMIGKNGPFCCGPDVSYGDFVIFHHLDLIRTLDGGATLAGHKAMTAFWKRMNELPALQEYLATRETSVGRPGSILETNQDPSMLASVQTAVKDL
mmetsp:Transcript_30314/g.54895  ORF Transcript_30314/g.54895 Transcript_30314/m.54895 type:complete len:236 (+) Transcript_30314:99-806(+)